MPGGKDRLPHLTLLGDCDRLSGLEKWDRMRSFTPWPFFPPSLEPPAARSLSLLFILKEWVSCFHVVERLKREQDRELDTAVILKKLEKLLFFSMENPHGQKGGLLDKLCFYSDILIQASKIADATLADLVEEMQQSIFRFRTKLVQAKKIPMPSIPIALGTLYSFLEQKLLGYFSTLIPYLQEARTDENVLIHLIEQKQTFNHFLGPRAIEELLRQFFPTGQPHLRAVICEGFTRRGFASFFAEKEAIIEELEWEVPCHPPTPLR